jgi:hypothetical protein
MPLRAVVDSSMLREAAKRVKDIDPEIRKGFIKDLKSDLKPYANSIAKDVPVLGRPGAMRGFGHGGRTRWSKVRASVYVNPGGGRGSLARIEVYGSGAETRAAFKIADLAGTKNDYGNGNMAKMSNGQPLYQIMGQGQDMVSRLTDFGKLSAGGKGGRFAWSGFMKHRPAFLKKSIKRLDEYSDRISRRFF